MEKIDEMREVINHQSKVIKQLKNELDKMKFVLGYQEKLENIHAFMSTLSNKGITLEKVMERPEEFTYVLNMIRKL